MHGTNIKLRIIMFTVFDILCVRLNISLTDYYSGDQIKKNDVDRTRDTYGEEESCTQGYDGDLKESDLLEDVGGDGRIRLKEIFKQWDGGVD
jgi:hypothetical protein